MVDFSKIVMLNGNILCKKVIYGEISTTDNKDTSHMFHQVMCDTSCGLYEKGDLIKYSLAFTKEVDINGYTYDVLDSHHVLFSIKSKDVDYGKN